ncbi:3-isopropylmalate dehydratase small subunit [Enterococcus saigonensis]|uniref:3-isopropylmalate dehydratase small subunit n=1 Tax=Enterococcus saigonensis TaxID=1805431 RepID=A0A679IDY5_9ENTE|nr:3-isopropylmalate dehydratase small subunit [Enterococcus saigonensis]BCA86519.1 3-isopropylmalate dehydratase small subunit [Enterococcus saigonensis]
MESFKIYTGMLVPFLNDNVDTDQIIPKAYLKRVDKKGFGQFLFDDWRYLSNRRLNPEFVLNFPHYQNATILISGDNFGSGSSREHAAWALMDYGFKAVIAGSFSDIFYMNATKNGLLPIVLNKIAREKLAALPPKTEITIDLPNQVVKTKETTFLFTIDAAWKNKLVNGLDEIDSTLEAETLISQYENERVPIYWQ